MSTRGIVVRLNASGIQAHLWVVVSEPHKSRNDVLAFNLTDRIHYPTCPCILHPHDHPKITKPSAVRYFAPKFWEAHTLIARIKDGTFIQYQNASSAVVNKIIDGAYLSDDLDPLCLEYLPPTKS
jgi:hypothetical protein